MGVTIKFTVPDEYSGIRLREYLRKKCGVSASLLTSLKQYPEGITLNGVHARVTEILKSGDITVIMLPDDECTAEPADLSAEILYEDEHIIVFNKPPYMPTHPVRGHQNDTLANAAAFLAQKKGQKYTFRAINRLDRDTSGALLAAKNSYAAALLPKTVHKIYVGVCEGIITQGGTIDAPIRLKEGHTIERETGEGGISAVTHYEPIFSGGGHTLLRFRLETGRTHQIRVHMASIGHSLAGDDMYGGSLEFISRQALHCAEISFQHPITNKQITEIAPIPQEFFALIKKQSSGMLL